MTSFRTTSAYVVQGLPYAVQSHVIIVLLSLDADFVVASQPSLRSG